MSNMKAIAAKHRKVGLVRVDTDNPIRGQLSAFGFDCQDIKAEDSDQTGIDLVVADCGVTGQSLLSALPHHHVPVVALCPNGQGNVAAANDLVTLPRRVSMFVLERAILRLFETPVAA